MRSGIVEPHAIPNRIPASAQALVQGAPYLPFF